MSKPSPPPDSGAPTRYANIVIAASPAITT